MSMHSTEGLNDSDKKINHEIDMKTNTDLNTDKESVGFLWKDRQLSEKFVRYFGGSAFAYLAIFEFYSLSLGFDSSTLLWAIVWTIMAVTVFRIDLLKKLLAPALPSKERLSSFEHSLDKVFGVLGKIIGILILTVIGYFAVRWVIGDVSAYSLPLAQLTLSDVGRIIFAIVLAIIWVKLIIAALTGFE
jgi:hypothetical protein